MASYHLDVKSVQRSAGRSATAAAAYRHACRIDCEREGRTHDYTRKAGVEASFIVAPEDAPAWAHDRQALWNAAEARDTRVNSVTAREWEVALPHELDRAGRRALAEGFARELVSRYGVATDVAIHAPHREGDKRNWHAHVMTTTRRMEPEGLTDKTRELDAKQTRGAEVTAMRERWAVLQNQALERHGHAERVDHRSLVAQREAALAHGDKLAAEALDRAPEVKLGPVVSAVERRGSRAAERDGHAYVPVTERGAQVHEARAVRSLLVELAQLRAAVREEVRERAELARETYTHAREEGTDRVRAGLAALRAAAQRQGIGHSLAHGREAGDERDRRQEREASAEGIKERLGRILGREAPHHAHDGPLARLPAHGKERRERRGHGQGREAHGERSHGLDPIRERLDAVLARARPVGQREEPAADLPVHGQGRERTREAHGLDPINERLRAVLGREQPTHGQDRDWRERAREAAREAHGLDPINERLRAVLARERPAAEREDPLAAVVERVREEFADAPSFATAVEAHAFRAEMERRFDPGTLARIGRGEAATLARITDDRLDGLCLARAWLDCQGEPPRSEARMSLAYRINDAQHDARREREGHEEDGHSWGL